MFDQVKNLFSNFSSRFADRLEENLSLGAQIIKIFIEQGSSLNSVYSIFSRLGANFRNNLSNMLGNPASLDEKTLKEKGLLAFGSFFNTLKASTQLFDGYDNDSLKRENLGSKSLPKLLSQLGLITFVASFMPFGFLIQGITVTLAGGAVLLNILNDINQIKLEANSSFRNPLRPSLSDLIIDKVSRYPAYFLSFFAGNIVVATVLSTLAVSSLQVVGILKTTPDLCRSFDLPFDFSGEAASAFPPVPGSASSVNPNNFGSFISRLFSRSSGGPYNQSQQSSSSANGHSPLPA